MARTPRCPICTKPVLRDEAFPFCSARCRSIDLGSWLGGDYRVETAPPEDLDPELVMQMLQGPEA
ncbi:MAG: DNA gyrase inhibitor YacG [Myxococcota bacterium]